MDMQMRFAAAALAFVIAVLIAACGSSDRSVQSSKSSGSLSATSSGDSPGATSGQPAKVTAGSAPVHIASVGCAHLTPTARVAQIVGEAVTPSSISASTATATSCLFATGSDTGNNIQIQVLYNVDRKPPAGLTRSGCPALGDGNSCGTHGDTQQEWVYWRGQEFSVTLLGGGFSQSAMPGLAAMVYAALQRDVLFALKHPPSAATAEDRAAVGQLTSMLSNLVACQNHDDSATSVEQQLNDCAGKVETSKVHLEIGQDGAFKATVTSSTGTTFVWSQADDGSADRTCSPAGRGDCRPNGIWQP
jgi:hypothetical protein